MTKLRYTITVELEGDFDDTNIDVVKLNRDHIEMVVTELLLQEYGRETVKEVKVS